MVQPYHFEDLLWITHYSISNKSIYIDEYLKLKTAYPCDFKFWFMNFLTLYFHLYKSTY